MTQQINLYNPAFLRRNPALEPAAWLAYAIILVLALALAATAWTRLERVQLEARAAAVDAQLKAEQDRSMALATQKAARKTDPALLAEVVRLESLTRGRRDSLGVIQTGGIGSTDGFAESMRALARQSINGLWLTGFSISHGSNEVALRGRMLDADLLPRYLARLGAEKAFEGKGFSTLVIAQPREAEVAGAGAAQAPPPPYLDFEIATRESVGRVPAAAAALPGGRK